MNEIKSPVKQEKGCIELNNIGSFVQMQANEGPLKLAYRFIRDDGNCLELTYGELDEAAKQLGYRLTQICEPKARVVLMFRPGLEFIKAFFACIYSGMIAVPVYPPGSQKEQWQKLESIAKDAQADLFVMDDSLYMLAQKWISDPAWFNLHAQSITQLSTKAQVSWLPVITQPMDLAFLQYTSGSTGQPKGVMVSHSNLLENQRVIKHKFEHDHTTKVVGWLPQYHDMGLIGNILQPIYLRSQATLMSPAAFLQNPLLWLKAISDYGATTSGAPNFAYDLCVDKIAEEDKQTLDLSSWNVAFTGAEPVNFETLKRFSIAFKTCGFAPESFYPCYGLAESTLLATGGNVKDSYKTLQVEKEALSQNRAVTSESDNIDLITLIGCGSVSHGECIIVDPELHSIQEEGCVGEIWLNSASVAKGYWQQTELSNQVFKAKLEGEEVEYLKTGDLGFVTENELFVTGRLKDLIIIRGKNYYPQDVELAVQNEIPQLRAGHGACFSIEHGGEERLILVHEVERTSLRKANFAQIANDVRNQVKKQINVSLYDLVLIKPNRLLKTSSGKIRRRECKKYYQENKFESLYSLLDSCTHTDHETINTTNISSKEQQFTSMLASQLNIAQSDIHLDKTLASYGLDSIDAVQLQATIEKEYHVKLELSELLYNYTSKQCLDVIALQKQETVKAVEQEVHRTNSAKRVSHNQLTFWQLQHMYPDSRAYNLSVPLKLNTQLNREILNRTVNILASRHPMLLTCYREVNGVLVQHLLHEFEVNVAWENSASDEIALIQKNMQQDIQLNFKLDIEPPIRYRVYQLSDNTSILHIVTHHIATDIWSLQLMVKELFDIYHQLLKGTTVALESNNYYQAFIENQYCLAAKDSFKEQAKLLAQRIEGKVKPVPLVSSIVRPASFAFKGHNIDFRLSNTLLNKLNISCSSHRVTLFNYLMAVFQLVLYRYSNESDFIIGTPVSEREGDSAKNVIGCFVDMKLLPCSFDGDMTFSALLEKVKADLQLMLKYRHIPTSDVINQLAQLPARNSAFQLPNVRFALHKAHILSSAEMFALDQDVSINIHDVTVSSVQMDNEIAQTDLALSMSAVEGELYGSLNYNAELFSASWAKEFTTAFGAIIEYCVDNPAYHLKNIPLLKKTSIENYFIERKLANEEILSKSAIHAYFEEKVLENPTSIAVKSASEEISYQTLNSRANQLSHFLSAQGVKKGTCVGLYFDRNINMITAFLAVLKAGASVLFFDLSVPKARKQYMLDASKINRMLTDRKDTDWCQHLPFVQNIIDIDMSNRSVSNPNIKVGLNDEAYLLFTSGSTGAPKAVRGIHRGLINRSLWMREHFEISTLDTVLHCTPMNYVRAEREILFALCSGASLAIANNDSLNKPDKLLEQIQQFGATFTASSPSLLEMMLLGHESLFAQVSTLKHWFIGADVLKNKLAKRIKQLQPNLCLTYFYGSTEVSSDVSFYQIPQETSVNQANAPVGKPLSNTGVYVLDEGLNPLPTGVPGELYISGFNLSGGYFDAPSLTAEKFITIATPAGDDLSLYRTGDIARFDRQGNLNILGRQDGQVSILGNRVDISEVENAISDCDAVEQVVVIAGKSECEQTVLTAYVVSALSNIDQVLKAHLLTLLPRYMHPAYFVSVDKIPYTELGKIDRNQLKHLKVNRHIQRETNLSSNVLESELAEQWAKIIKVSPSEVDVDDGFFERGGNSLKVNELYASVSKAFPDKTIKLTDLYKHNTIRQLAVFIGGDSKQSSVKKAASSRASRRRQAVRKAIVK